MSNEVSMRLIRDNQVITSPNSGNCIVELTMQSGTTFNEDYLLMWKSSQSLWKITHIYRQAPSYPNKVLYTTSDENPITPYVSQPFDVNIISNVYTGGTGVIECDGPITAINDRAFEHSSNCHLLSFTCPSGLQTIGERAFYGQYAIRDVSLPITTLTSVGWAAFADSGVGFRSLPDSVTTLGSSIFESTTHLNEIEEFYFPHDYNIGTANQGIPQSILSGCQNLWKVIFGPDVTHLNYGLFQRCTSLSTILCYAPTPPTCHQYAFYNIPSTGTVRYPSGSDYTSWRMLFPSGWNFVGDL